MLLLWIVLALILAFLGYLFLLAFFPKGNLLQEFIALPYFWFKVWDSPRDQMRVSKHSYGQHSRQYLLCCEPLEGASNSEEVVVYYHGGGWMLGTPEKFQSNAQFFVDRGYTVFVPSYRRIPFFSYPAINEDLEASLLLIEELKIKKKLPAARLLVGGMSAGANLAALIAFDRKRLARLKLSDHLISGAFLFGAPLDLEGMYASLPLYWFAGKKNSEQFKQANPAFHLLEKESLPICCIHGDKDGMVPVAAATQFIEKIKPIHSGVLHFKILDNSSHIDSASWVHSDNAVRQSLIQWLDESAPR